MLKRTWLTFVTADIMANSLIWDTPYSGDHLQQPGLVPTPCRSVSFFYDSNIKRTLSKTDRPSARPKVSVTVLLVNRNAILFFQLTV